MDFLREGSWPIGVLAGNDQPAELLKSWLVHAPFVIAADSGADRCLEVGIRPHILVGDLDSASLRAREHAMETRFIGSQDRTDCDKLLEVAVELGHEKIALVSAEGDRPDHTLAAYHSAARAPLRVRFLHRSGWAEVVPERRFQARVGAERRVSILPLEASQVSADGLQWPLQRAHLNARGFTSISNISSAAEITVEVHSGCVVVFVGGEESR